MKNAWDKPPFWLKDEQKVKDWESKYGPLRGHKSLGRKLAQMKKDGVPREARREYRRFVLGEYDSGSTNNGLFVSRIDGHRWTSRLALEAWLSHGKG